jgi:hypothetical protein
LSLKTTQLVALTTGAVGALTTAQLCTLTDAQVGALTTSQIAAIGTANIGALFQTTPLALDLNGGGVNTLNIKQGVEFDIFASGQQVQTGWIDSGDGLLVLDRNQDGVINDGSELFGSSTVLPSGQAASDGYSALQALDDNHDGMITSADSVFGDLRVWVDGNSDGVSQTAELKSLDALGITKIDSTGDSTVQLDNGNLIGLVSSYETSDGQTHDMADVWFVAETPTVAEEDSGLHANVKGLVEAIASFNEWTAQQDVASGSLLVDFNKDGASSPITPTMTMSVGNMVEVLKQYQAGPLAGTSAVQVAAVKPFGVGAANPFDPPQTLADAVLPKPGGK